MPALYASYHRSGPWKLGEECTVLESCHGRRARRSGPEASDVQSTGPEQWPGLTTATRTRPGPGPGWEAPHLREFQLPGKRPLVLVGWLLLREGWAQCEHSTSSKSMGGALSGWIWLSQCTVGWWRSKPGLVWAVDAPLQATTWACKLLP